MPIVPHPRLLAVLGRGLLDPDEPVIHADDLGVTRGDGCFEGCRVLAAGPQHREPYLIDKLDAHLSRFADSARALEIEFDEPAWRTLIAEALRAWAGPPEAAARLVLTRGHGNPPRPAGYLMITELPARYAAQRADGIAVITLDRGVLSDAFCAAPWLLGGVKTLSYAINMAAQREAARRGAQDVVFVAADGMVLEAPTGAVVWSVGGLLATTPTGPTGILASTTQRRLFANAPAAGWRTEYALITLADLHAAESVWLLSSTRGPVEVVALDGKPRERDAGRHAQIVRLSGFGPRGWPS